jgi:hypothetical protein
VNPGRHAEGEVAREAKRVLRKLLVTGARLVPADRSYALLGAAGKRQVSAALALVDAFRRRDWLAPCAEQEGAFVLSDAWIRRALADDDPFAAQHHSERRREIATDDGTTATVNEGESLLGWPHRRRGSDGRTLIDDVQFAAGQRLRSNFTLAQLSPAMAVDLTAPVVAGRRGAKSDTPLPEIVLAAKQRFARALDAVGGGLSDLLVDVCCHLIGREAAERAKGWPQRSAKVVLTIALDRLATHYGLGRVVGTGNRSRAWAAPEEKKSPANLRAVGGRRRVTGSSVRGRFAKLEGGEGEISAWFILHACPACRRAWRSCAANSAFTRASSVSARSRNCSIATEEASEARRFPATGGRGANTATMAIQKTARIRNMPAPACVRKP